MLAKIKFSEVILVAGGCGTVATLVGVGFGIPAGVVGGIVAAALLGSFREPLLGHK